MIVLIRTSFTDSCEFNGEKNYEKWFTFVEVITRQHWPGTFDPPCMYVRFLLPARRSKCGKIWWCDSIFRVMWYGGSPYIRSYRLNKITAIEFDKVIHVEGVLVY